MRSEGSRRANLGARGRRRGGATPQSAALPVPRPGDGTSRERDRPGPPRTRLPPSSAGHAAAASWPKRNSPPSARRRCSTVESLRASATLARRMPRRFATSSPHRFRVENLPALVSMTFAASYRAARTIASPALLMPPVTSVSPDWYFFGVNPKYRHQRPHAGDRHQPPADRVLAHDREHRPVQRQVLGAQRVARPQHRLRDKLPRPPAPRP